MANTTYDASSLLSKRLRPKAGAYLKSLRQSAEMTQCSAEDQIRKRNERVFGRGCYNDETNLERITLSMKNFFPTMHTTADEVEGFRREEGSSCSMRTGDAIFLVCVWILPPEQAFFKQNRN